ncbi:FUN14 domain-containing protein 1-like [Sitophilus oryzae]|uniref:FUN14 domain-containing protein 1-like n=1 Tax=Sitophilus oryzae TaxID=7048 RepID=A0A6J2XSJ8_SITOR|nr:FUN14 domain-containing protein 1-like [Sitophilus oryzae]
MTSLSKSEKNKVNKEENRLRESDLFSANKYVEDFYNGIRKLPSNQQILIASTSGWILGVFTMKIGRALAVVLGGGLILLQYAREKGYVTINPDTSEKEKEVRNTHPSDETIGFLSQWFDNLIKFASRSSSMTSGFLGGFFIGLASF